MLVESGYLFLKAINIHRGFVGGWWCGDVRVVWCWWWWWWWWWHGGVRGVRGVMPRDAGRDEC